MNYLPRDRPEREMGDTGDLGVARGEAPEDGEAGRGAHDPSDGPHDRGDDAHERSAGSHERSAGSHERSAGGWSDAAGEPSGRAVVRRVGEGVRELSLETQNYVDAVARGLGHHRSDVAAIGALLEAARAGEPLTPSALARRLNLSAPAVSALLDRLERAGHAHRRRHDTDRRMIVVEPTQHARDVSRAMFEPLTRQQVQALTSYSDDELALVARVLADLAAAARQSYDERPR